MESQDQLIGAPHPRSSELESSCSGPGHGNVCVCGGVCFERGGNGESFIHSAVA